MYLHTTVYKEHMFWSLQAQRGFSCSSDLQTLSLNPVRGSFSGCLNKSCKRQLHKREKINSKYTRHFLPSHFVCKLYGFFEIQIIVWYTYLPIWSLKSVGLVSSGCWKQVSNWWQILAICSGNYLQNQNHFVISNLYILQSLKKSSNLAMDKQKK